jgi:CelD/BcsL family acetyltransferase involved in cellulose biosynthesis
LKIIIYTEFNKNLENIWSDFEKNALMTAFQCYSWLSHWYDTVGNPIHNILPQIVIVKNGEEVMAIFPLGLRVVYGIKMLEWLGGIHADYMAPIVGSDWDIAEEEFKVLWSNIRTKISPHDAVNFERQPNKIESIINPILKLHNAQSSDISSNISLNGNWHDYYKNQINKKIRADSRRNMRRLSEIGEVCFNIGDSEAIEKLIISKMVIQKRQRYTDTGARDLLSVREHREFYEKLPSISKTNGFDLHCSSLTVGDTIIACHVGIIHRDRFLYLMPSHDANGWLRYSPGRLLLEYLIEWSFSTNLKYFDFTIGGENYKKIWCNDDEFIYQSLSSNNLKGTVFLLVQKIKLKIINRPIVLRIIRKIRSSVNKLRLTA